MRIHIHLSKNSEIVPFNYQEVQVSKLHYWLGKNEVHDKLSLYSFCWLKNGKQEGNKGLNFRAGSQFFISCYDSLLIRQLIKSIQQDNDFGWGMKITSLNIEREPDFNSTHKFLVGSPVFIKRPRISTDTNETQYYYHNDEESNKFLTETLIKKLEMVGLSSEGLEVKFDDTYSNPQVKGTVYKGIRNKGSICPVIIKGTPDQLAFAWNVGVGNSTGIGFGSLI